MGKTIVVGGGGFIGSHLAERAAIRGEEVVVIDDLSRTNHNYEYLKKNFPKINFVKADIRNLDSFSNYFTDAEKIFHTAGQVAVTTSVLNPKLDYEINSTGTFNVCEAARRANTNPAIVYCSTNKVFGDLVIPVVEMEKRYKYKNIIGINEKYDVSPETANCPYGAVK